MARTRSFAEEIRGRPGHVIGTMTFPDLPVSTVAHGLARLASRGELMRVRRGLYYVPRPSRFGPVPPDPIHTTLGALGEVELMPGGTAAANALGFTTQLPMGVTDVISTRGRRVRRDAMPGIRILERSIARKSLTADENAFLEVLRDPVNLIELSPVDACGHAVELLRSGRIELRRILPALWDEPPRVRAIVGALADRAGAGGDDLKRIRGLINGRSRFDFGPFSALPTARSWGAKRD